MRRSLVAGNWKMHGSAASTHELLRAIATAYVSVGDVELAVFPPFPYLAECAPMLAKTSVKWGAQTVSEFLNGAYTGEVSAAMLKDLGCHYVIIGHSERRHLMHESNDQILKKCQMAFSAGITPILCVGETLAQRENNLTWSSVQEQLAVVSILKDNCAAFSNMVIAYEPVWAIGTGRSATPDQAQEVHALIRTYLSSMDAGMAQSTPLLYGGSVKADNAKTLFAMPDIDGALVGGASLDAKQFLEIGRLCSN